MLRQCTNGYVSLLVIIKPERKPDIGCIVFIKSIEYPKDDCCQYAQRYRLPVRPVELKKVDKNSWEVHSRTGLTRPGPAKKIISYAVVGFLPAIAFVESIETEDLENLILPPRSTSITKVSSSISAMRPCMPPIVTM